jgi:hypothetical protein
LRSLKVLKSSESVKELEGLDVVKALDKLDNLGVLIGYERVRGSKV